MEVCHGRRHEYLKRFLANACATRIHDPYLMGLMVCCLQR